MMATSQRAVSDAWLAKFEQAHQKAQLLLNGSQELFRINELYERKFKEIQKKKRQLPIIIIGAIGGSLLIVLLIWLLVFLTGSI